MENAGPVPRVVGDVRVGWDGSAIVVEGDRTAAREIGVAVGAGVEVAAELRSLLVGRRHRLDPFGVSQLLAFAHVPMPHTVFEGIWTLGMGDRLEVRSDEHGATLGKVGFAFPFLLGDSRQDGIPDPGRLMELLAGSVERRLAGVDPIVLALSGGKDSTSVAAALAVAGLADRTVAVTFSNGVDDPEPVIAAETARRFGLRHEVVTLPDDPGVVEDRLRVFFRNSHRPSGDYAQLPYALAISRAVEFGDVVVDGGGNDSYMGFLPSRRDLVKFRLRIRGRTSRRVAGRLTPVGSPVNYLARPRAAVGLPLRTLRFHEIRRFYPDAVDPRDFWEEESQRTRHLELPDLLRVAAVRHVDPQASMLKLRLATAAFGARPVMPFCDDAIADYYFHLPEEARFDAARGRTKVLLRELLARYADYDADRVGKHPFRFDGPGFLRRHRRFVVDEILGCALWDRAALEPMVRRWFDELQRRPETAHALVVLFQVSAWLNHATVSPVRPS